MQDTIWWSLAKTSSHPEMVTAIKPIIYEVTEVTVTAKWEILHQEGPGQHSSGIGFLLYKLVTGSVAPPLSLHRSLTWQQ